MKCSLNLKAPNGQNSRLFEDIVENSLNMEDAINTYYYTKTDHFQDQYKGMLDSNQEPIFREIDAEEGYDFCQDYKKMELDESAAMYTVDSLRDRNMVKMYLEGFGFKVKHINTSMYHGSKPREMFYCES